MPDAINPCCVTDDRLDDFFWLIGWLEGEGCFSYSNSPLISGTSTDEDTLEKASLLMGANHYTAEPVREHWKPYWRFGVYGDLAIDWMDALLPYMSIRRQQRIRELLLRRSKRAGRAIGSRNPRSKLSEGDIPQIRLMYDRGTKIASIARTYKVAWGSIRDIVYGLGWKHVA
jgi:hypothetical protein